MTPPRDAFLEAIDSSKLSARYWLTAVLLMLGLVGELYDFFIAGFIVSAVAPEWGLTFGQSGLILVAVGLGAIVGSLTFGRLADQIGRKVTLVAGGLICAATAGAIAFLPDHAWIPFALLRFLVGFGYAGASVTQLALFVEFTPTRHRTLLSSLILAPVAGGMLLAALTFATLSPALGWRGVAALGAAPVVVTCLLWAFCPESVRWLAARGRIERARQTLAKFLGRPLDEIPMPTAAVPGDSGAPLGDLLRDPRRFWLIVLVYFGFNVTITGCYLSGPVIVAQLLGIPPRQAAMQFVYVSVIGAAGRVAFSFLPHRLGRVRAGQIAAFGAALAMAGAGVFHGVYIGQVPVFLLFLVGGALFWDGGTSAISPYAPEVFPVRMAARGMGLGQAAGGLGKFVSPAVLALIAGSGNLITPQTTAAAVTPCFLFLAAGALVTGLAFTFLGVEPHGKALSLA
jgi:putative MFS transporter